MRRLTICVVLSSLFGVGITRAEFQPHLEGVIRDPTDAAVPEASVTVVNEDTGFRRLTSSHSDGSYGVGFLEPGLYKVTVRHPGFRTLIRLGVRVDAAQPVRVDFNLTLGSMQESITVHDSSSLPLEEDPAIETVITEDEIEHVPASGHDVSSLLQFAPGTIVTPATRGESGQFISGGQRPNANYFTVDGVSANTGVSGGGLPAQATGGALPMMSALGSLHGLLPLEATNEMRVQTSTTAPEFGSLPGAQIVLTSRSGTNEFHGSAYDYFRNQTLDANDWFANSQGQGRIPAHMNDFGASLGGPLWRDRTFFFVSYEGMRLMAPFAWRTAVPDIGIRLAAPDSMRPLLTLFPQPNGPELGLGLAEWTGQTHRPARFDATNVRIDHALTSRVTLFGRFNETPSFSEFGNAEIDKLTIGSRGLTLGLDANPEQHVVLTLRLNASTASLNSVWTTPGTPACGLEPVVHTILRVANACDYLLRFSIAGVGQVVSGEEPSQRQSQWNAATGVMLTYGGHQFHIGADYIQLNPLRNAAKPSLGVIADNVADSVNAANLWIAVGGTQTAHAVLKQDSLFVHDTWRVHPRLTLSYGLRWEFTPPLELKPIPILFEEPSGPSYVFTGQNTVWRRTYGNFAPRAGLAFRPTMQSHTVLRAGWGLYYDSGLSIATDLLNGGPFSLSQYTTARSIFPQTLSYGFAPDLHLPAVKQWSATVEHVFGAHQVVSAVYEGASGMDLLRREFDGPQTPNPLTLLALATNNGWSNYQALDLQYRLKPWHGWSGLASYSWAHSIDNSSSDSVLYWSGSGLTPASDRGSSDFDVRHALQGIVSYEAPQHGRHSFRSSLLRGWGFDGVIHARTGFPITVLDTNYAEEGLSFANVFRPNIAYGQPVWIADPSAPGGRELNIAAFQPGATQVQGNLGRNSVRGFGIWQVDLALRRNFALDARRAIEFRVEAFNALNHANYGDPVPFLSSPLFGQSVSMLNMMLGTGSPGSGLTPLFQNGGARTVQIMLRFRF